MDLAKTSYRRRPRPAVPGVMTAEGMRAVVARDLGASPDREFVETIQRIDRRWNRILPR
jgi:hypothetical protein